MRRETKTWAGRLFAAAAVAFVLAYVPYHLYARSGLARTLALRRDLAALRAHNRELRAGERSAGARGGGAARRRRGDRAGGARRARLGASPARSSCDLGAGDAAGSAGEGAEAGASGSAIRSGAPLRASLALRASAAWSLVLLWRGWFPDMRLPGADLRRAAAAALLTAMLADQDRGARAHHRAPPHAAARGASPTPSWGSCC